MKIKAFAAAALAATFALSSQAVSFNMLSCCPGENTATEARFVWHSDVSSSCEFYYSLSPETGGTKVTPKCDDPQCTFIDKNASGTEIWHSNFYYKYTVELSGLQPDTTYYYWVTIGGSRVGNVQKFKTGSMNTNFKFFWLSDVHADPDDAAKTNNVVTILNKAKESAGVSEFDFVLFSGDSVKWGNRYHHWQQWNQNLPFSNYMTALLPGNKEYYEGGNGYSGTDRVRHYKYYMEMRNDPGNGASGVPTSYWFLRNGVLFVMIDSIFSDGRDIDSTLRNKAVQAQTNWFDRVATEQRGKYQYIVAVQHYPYLKGSDICDYGNCEEWFPVFSKHQVDFALSGDSHQFTRSKPLISKFKDESLSNQTYDLNSSGVATTGTVYIVASEIPKSPYSFTVNDGSGIIAKIASSGSSNGAGWFEVNTESITYHNISWGGAEVDKITVKAKRPPVAIGGGTTGGDATPHRRYRFKVDAPRSDSLCMQLSEIQLLDASGTAIPSNSFTIAYDSMTRPADGGDTYPSNESPPNAVDGRLDTKWLDWRAGLSESAATRSVVWLDFCFDSPTTVSGYQWYTANDAPARSPVSWTFSASDDDGATWTVLDKVVDYDTTTEYETLAYKKVALSEDETTPVAATAEGRYYALTVGVDLYKDPDNNLNCCNPDVKNVLSACTNSANGLWSPSNCYRICDSNATLSAVRAQFQSLAATAQSGDTVLYYQSSHGSKNALCLHDKNYSESDFASDLMRFNSGVRVIVMLDACHSASMFKGVDAVSKEDGPWNFAANVEARMAEIREELRAKGAKAINSPSIGWVTACDHDQLSWGGSSGSTFTKKMVNAWKSASATDANGDGYNDFLEIFTVAAPQATSYDDKYGWTIPQKLNDDVLAGVAAWELYEHHPDTYIWTGLGGDGDFSNGANWQAGEPPVAGVTLDFTGLTTNATLNVDIENTAFGKLVMGNAVVTFTGSISAAEISDTSKIAVGENATVTLNGDLIYTATTGDGWMLNRLDGVFEVTGSIVVSGSADMKLAQSIGANGVAVVKGLVSNNSGTPWTFRLNRSNSGDTARWVIGEEGLSGDKGFWMYAASSSSSAIIQPYTNDFTIADWIGAREGPSLTIDTTGWEDNAPHVITATAGFIREGVVSVVGTGTLVCDYDASSGAYDQSAHSVAFDVGESATLALAAGSNIGTGGVTVGSGAALALAGAGTARIGGALSLQGGSRLVVGGALNVNSLSLPESGTVAVSLSAEPALNVTTTVLSIAGGGALTAADLAKFSPPDGYILSLGAGGKSLAVTRYTGTWTGGMALSVPSGGLSIGSAAFDISNASRDNPVTVTIGDGGELAGGSSAMVLSAGSLPETSPAAYMALSNEVPDGYAAQFSTVGSAIYVNVVSVKWIEENAAKTYLTGRWSEDVEYGSDGKANIIGDNVFTPYSASTGNVVTIETKTSFYGCEIFQEPEPDTQVAVCLSTNNCFQVWAGSEGPGKGEWVDVAAEGLIPVAGAEYTLRFSIDYTANKYSVDIKDGSSQDFAKLGASGQTSFALAYVTNRVSEIRFSGNTQFTSLCGESVEVSGFGEYEEVVLAGSSTILNAAKAEWLNKLGAKAAVSGALASIKADKFEDAYLMNIDFTKGDFTYEFAVTGITVKDSNVEIEVTLKRYGTLGPDGAEINGTLNFYGASTLDAFKNAPSKLGTATLDNGTFGNGDTATATFPKGDNKFFNSKIE